MKHVSRVPFTIVSVIALAMMFFVASPLSAYAASGSASTSSGSNWGLWNIDQSHPSGTIYNPRNKSHRLLSSSARPLEASGCTQIIDDSATVGTTMKATLNVNCLGGTVYWSYNVMYSEHCIQSLAGVCWAGWDETNTLPECSAYNIASLTCGPYLREAVSGQLWRWRADTCITFLPTDVAECDEETAQLQF